MRYDSMEIDQVTILKSQVGFPYIPGYLSFRELPVLLKLLRSVPNRPDILLVDGAGILHPRQCGLACLVGLLADIPTIGVAKSHLAGNVATGERIRRTGSGHIRLMELNGQRLGGVFQRPQRGRPILYVSPGHRVGLASSLRIVERTLAMGRLPAPIRWADRISRNPAIAPKPLRILNSACGE
jgi:deoxyribonuclease V